MTIESRGEAPGELTRRLATDEKLIWWDRPIPALFARREVNFGLLFGAFFFCFSLFWMSMASRAPGLFFLFGLPFTLVGLWMVSSPIRAYYNAQSTFFGLTDRRALVLKGTKMKAFPLEQIEFVETESFPDGSGHVEFYKDMPSSVQWAGNAAWTVQKFGFLAIADADRVAREMVDLREKRRNPGANPGTALAR